MHITAKQAAEIIGISKTAVINAIKKQDLKAERNSEGSYQVLATEAERYRDNRAHKTPERKQVVAQLATNDINTLQVKLEEKDKLINELNQRLKEKDEQIERERLVSDRAAAMIKQTLDQLPVMIADQTAERERKEKAGQGRGLFSRLFG